VPGKTPNTKLQTPEKLQEQNSKRADAEWPPILSPKAAEIGKWPVGQGVRQAKIGFRKWDFGE
jgi:hypothetical protein